MMFEDVGMYTRATPPKDSGLPPQTVTIPYTTFQQTVKVLKWVKDNPGIHPENIRTELRKLEKLFNVE